MNKKISTYEDDSVISKDKYDKMKAVKTDAQIETNNKEKTVNSSVTLNKPSENHQMQILKYQTESFDKKDCFLRILYPNGDRLDFTTNGDSNLKVRLFLFFK